MVVERTYVLTLAAHELDIVCEALYLYQANQRGYNDHQAELAGALRKVLNRATVEVFWAEDRARHHPTLPLEPS